MTLGFVLKAGSAALMKPGTSANAVVKVRANKNLKCMCVRGFEMMSFRIEFIYSSAFPTIQQKKKCPNRLTEQFGGCKFEEFH